MWKMTWQAVSVWPYLEAGAFRLAAAAVHRAACAALERLVLHRAHDDVSDTSFSSSDAVTAAAYATSGGSLSGTAAVGIDRYSLPPPSTLYTFVH
jgi:hypothetical protein